MWRVETAVLLISKFLIHSKFHLQLYSLWVPTQISTTSIFSITRKLVKEADVVIGAVLVAGAKAPKLVTREMLKTMQKGSVLVDVAIDQGGCFEILL